MLEALGEIHSADHPIPFNMNSVLDIGVIEESTWTCTTRQKKKNHLPWAADFSLFRFSLDPYIVSRLSGTEFRTFYGTGLHWGS